MTKPEYKTGIELEVGDWVASYNGAHRKITGFDSHPGVTGEIHSPARVVCFDDYRITVFDDDHYRLTSDDSYIATHHWFSYENKE